MANYEREVSNVTNSPITLTNGSASVIVAANDTVYLDSDFVDSCTPIPAGLEFGDIRKTGAATSEIGDSPKTELTVNGDIISSNNPLPITLDANTPVLGISNTLWVDTTEDPPVYYERREANDVVTWFDIDGGAASPTIGNLQLASSVAPPEATIAARVTGIDDSANLDAFSRLRVSTPSYLFDAQFTYDLQPLLFEQIATNGGGGTATVAHDSTNRCALMTFTNALTGAKAYMQSYEWMPYQPGRSHLIFVTFNFIEGVANVFKFAGVGDGVNGIQLELNGTTLQASIYSGTKATDTVAQNAWNLDTFDGNGPSGIVLDKTKTQILVIDYQALYVGRVRLGFDINGSIYYFHEFKHSNTIAVPYIQIASLPVRCGMTGSGTVSTTMRFVCSSVISEGGSVEDTGFKFSYEATGAAGNSTAAHILSVRPKTTFNSIANRSKFVLESIDFIVTGNNSVRFDVVIGQAISGTTTFQDINTAYSAMEYNTAGTISGSEAIKLFSAYSAASASVKSAASRATSQRYPITLNAAGAQRALGTLSIIATGIGNTSNVRVILNWIEIR